MPPIPPKVEVSPRELRDRFNRGNYVERVAAGELTARVLKDGHPSPPRAGLPICTRSQSIAYFDAKGDEVAMIHQYLKPDGTLGASGRPDPKRLLENGVLYVAWWEPRGSNP
jgi:hypothetical protein